MVSVKAQSYRHGLFRRCDVEAMQNAPSSGRNHARLVSSRGAKAKIRLVYSLRLCSRERFNAGETYSINGEFWTRFIEILEEKRNGK